LPYLADTTRYFEEPIELEVSGHRLRLDDGVVTAEPLGPGSPFADGAHELLQRVVLLVLRGAQVQNHEPFELDGPTLHSEDGITVFGKALALGVSICRGDMLALDSNGNVVQDTRQQRIRERAELSRLAARYGTRDPTAGRILRSYESAVRDPADELIHLYEVRDALRSRFGSDKNARRRVGVTRKNWNRLGYLANEAPISQGRHRGRHGVSLRDASNAELGEARLIVRGMVLSYFLWLEAQDP